MSREIFIGDVQGCVGSLERLLDKLRFDPSSDRLRLAGDLVNRGGESLATLRLVHGLRHSLTVVLGNHDLHLLAYAHGRRRASNPEFDAIVAADDGPELLAWLQNCPLFWQDSARRLALVHAGVDPRWGPAQCRVRAAEVECALATDPDGYFTHMYGNHPDRWKPELPARERLRCITNVLTRIRFCRADGRLELHGKGGIDSAPPGFAPWFEHLHADWRGWTLVFGHWSQLGLYRADGLVGLDTGCVWGGALTALVVDGDERLIRSVDCR